MKKLLLSRWLSYMSEQKRAKEAQTKQSQSKAARSARFDIENLEQRLMMAGDVGTMVDGVLTGSLTTGDDEVVVARTGIAGDGGLIIDLTVNGVTEQFGSAAAGVKGLVLN